MTKEVLVRISGLQIMDGERDDIEVITTGDYYLKNGKHYVIYDEVLDGFDEGVRNTLKISADSMDIRKKGAANAHMVFEQDKKNMTRYATPMGEMMVEISTNRIQIDEQEDSLKVKVDYSLGINYEHVSDCNIMLDVCSRGKAQLHLQPGTEM